MTTRIALAYIDGHTQNTNNTIYAALSSGTFPAFSILHAESGRRKVKASSHSSAYNVEKLRERGSGYIHAPIIEKNIN